jgi:hypothetical protein
MSQRVIGIMGKKFVDKDKNLAKTCEAMQRPQPQNFSTHGIATLHCLNIVHFLGRFHGL